MKKNFIIQVAPLVRLPILKTQVFSYLCDKTLPIGTLVNIPFHRRIIQGIVVSSKKDFPRTGGIKLKKINSVVEEKMLPEWQIELAKKLSNHYLSPLGIFLKLMTPEKILNIKKKKEKIRKIFNKNKFSYSEESKILLNDKNKKILVIGSAGKRLNLNLSLVSRITRTRKQCFVLVPEIYYSYEMQRKFQEYFPDEEIALVHGRISKGQFFDLWKKIREGKIKIVVATKLGVLLPFSKLGLVIVEEEQDISHKQWNMNPRYSAVRVAEILAGLWDAKIVFGSFSPSVETFWKAEKEKWQILNMEKSAGEEKKTEVVDLYQERNNPDFPVSKKLYEGISRALDEKKKILLLAKRRGYSTFSVCQNCKSILKCSQCDRPVVYFEDSHSYRCLHCPFRSDLFSFCSNCGGFQFSHLGIGTQLVERKIKRLFPSARVARLDADSVRVVKKYGEFSEKLRNRKLDIVIGTQIAMKLGGFFDFDLVGIVSAQEHLHLADFNSMEQALSSFRQAKNLVKETGRFLVQTFSPKEEVLDYLNSKSYRDFYKNEIKLRKKLFYPPFSGVVKLSYRDNSKKKTEKEAKEVFDLLAAAGNNEIEVSEPYEPPASKKRGYFYKNILIKIPCGKRLEKLPLYPIIGGLGKGWTVDVDPISTV